MQTGNRGGDKKKKNKVAVTGGSTVGSVRVLAARRRKLEVGEEPLKLHEAPRTGSCQRYTGHSRHHYPGEKCHIDEAVLFTGECFTVAVRSLKTGPRSPPQQESAPLACEIADVV